MPGAIQNDYSHGTPGVTLTTGNSGNGSTNTAATTVSTPPAGATLAFESAAALHGLTVGVRVTSNATTGLFHSYPLAVPSAGEWQYAQGYEYIDTLPNSGTAPLMVAGCKLMLSSTGSFSAQNFSGTGIAGSTPAGTITAGTLIRWETWRIPNASTTGGTFGYAVWAGATLESANLSDALATWESNVISAGGTAAAANLFLGKPTSTATTMSKVTRRFDMQNLTIGTRIAPKGASSSDATVSAPRATVTLRTPRTGTGGKVAMIGDSQFDQFPSQTGVGEGRIRAQMVAAGFTDTDIWFHGVGGKTLSSADSTGTTTIQNVAAARAAIGEPDLWVINLGGNSSGSSETTFKANMNAILDAIGNTHRVLWFGIQGNPNTTDRENANGWVKQTIEARPLGKYADVNTYLHTFDATPGIWQGDAIHLTDTGYTTYRNPYVAAQAWEASPLTGGITASASTIITTPVSTASLTAPVPTVTAVRNATVVAPRPAATLAALVPTVTTVRNVTAAAPLATVSLTAPLPAVTAGGSVTVMAPRADATLTAPVPIVTVVRNVTATAPVGTVQLTAPAPAVSAGGNATIPAPRATATMTAPAAAMSAASTVVGVRAILALMAPAPSVSDGTEPVGTLPDPGDLVLASGGATSNPFRIGTPRRL